VPLEAIAEPIEALRLEADRLGGFLAGLEPAQWRLETRCPPMNVRELAVHVVRGAYRIVEFLSKAPVEGEPEKDGVTYFQYDPVATGSAVVKRAKAESEARPADADIAAEFRTAWTDAYFAVEKVIADDPVVASPGGTLRLSEYLRTRCVEVTIHHMDLRDALGLAPDPTAKGLEAACDVLRGLLGTDLRPLGMDEIRFALVGTGRGELSAAEREMLGPLADSFPLLQ